MDNGIKPSKMTQCNPETPKQTSMQWLEERLTLAFPAQENILRVYFQMAREMDAEQQAPNDE
jgi:hypothetical protein